MKKLTCCWYIYDFLQAQGKGLVQYFSEEENLAYLNNITQLLNKLGCVNYDLNDWRLFIDASKRSLKGVLLHNGNEFASVPVAHSVYLKKNYETMKNIFEKIQYNNHQWLVCGYLKVMCMLLGLQQGFIIFPCYVCERASQARKKHWKQK